MATHLLLNMSNHDIEIRVPSEEELEAFYSAIAIGFGGTGTFEKEELDSFLKFVGKIERWAAYDGERIVGSMGYIDFQTASRDKVISTAGVTIVTVSPTHRRRGILTRMMEIAQRDAIDRGCAMASLYASEPPIYGRFGFGLAMSRENQKIDRSRAVLTPSHDTGSIRLVDWKSRFGDVEHVFNRAGADRLGWIKRSELAWDHRFEDQEWNRRGDGELQCAVYYDGESAEGYVLYRRTSEDRTGLKIDELVGVTRAAEHALWNYCFGMDLVEEVSIRNRPMDDSLPWMLTDTRALERIPQDSIWTRIFDVSEVLESRAYSAVSDLAITVIDESGGYAAGTFLLSASEDGATCTPTDRSPDLTMNVAQLGTIAFGGTRASVLARAGLIDENSVGALSRADGMFATRKAPWTVVDF
jgi:predicted acetyltransferase